MKDKNGIRIIKGSVFKRSAGMPKVVCDGYDPNDGDVLLLQDSRSGIAEVPTKLTQEVLLESNWEVFGYYASAKEQL